MKKLEYPLTLTMKPVFIGLRGTPAVAVVCDSLEELDVGAGDIPLMAATSDTGHKLTRMEVLEQMKTVYTSGHACDSCKARIAELGEKMLAEMEHTGEDAQLPDGVRAGMALANSIRGLLEGLTEAAAKAADKAKATAGKPDRSDMMAAIIASEKWTRTVVLQRMRSKIDKLLADPGNASGKELKRWADLFLLASMGYGVVNGTPEGLGDDAEASLINVYEKLDVPFAPAPTQKPIEMKPSLIVPIPAKRKYTKRVPAATFTAPAARRNRKDLLAGRKPITKVKAAAMKKPASAKKQAR